MTSKKLQNFVRSKVNTHSNVSISFSKAKVKSDSLEEPLFADDNGSNISNECDIDKEKFTSVQVDEHIDNDNQAKPDNLDFEILSTDTLNAPDAANPVPIRSRVEIIGKSVNTAFKDAQSALSAIKENAKKRSIRKPSDITKGRSKFNLSKKKAQELLNETDDKNSGLSSVKKEEIMKAFNVIPESELKSADNVAFSLDDVDSTAIVSEIDDAKISYSKDALLRDNEPIRLRSEIKATSDLSEDKQSDEAQFNASSNVNADDQEDNNASSSNDLIFNFTSLKILGVIGGVIGVFFFFSLSKFILGLICGLLMAFGIFKIYESLYLSNIDDPLLPTNTIKYPHLRSFPNPVVPHVEETPIKDEYASPNASYSAWVNAVNNYHPNWNNLAGSYTLHVSLEGTKLRMKRTKQKLTSRHFIGDTAQLLSPPAFISERVVELLHSNVHLLPYGLVKRRIWSKKYPICITLSQSANDRLGSGSQHNLLMNNSRSSDNLESLKIEGTSNLGSNSGLPVGNGNSDLNLYFFPKTCREKEEMYRRFMAASLGMPITLTISDIIEKYLIQETKNPNQLPVPLVNLSAQDDEENARQNESMFQRKNQNSKSYQQKEPNLVTYVRFMAKFMPSDNYMFQMKSQNIKLNYVDCEPELLWLNALIGRVAWDVFRGNFWMKVIREKIQRKLRKLPLPYFINQLEVRDIDLGTELPVIRKVSRPYLDYRGLWVEFNVVYAGGFSMELETKVNLMKLKQAANQHHKSTKNTSNTSATKSSHPADVGIRYIPSADVLMPSNPDLSQQQGGQGSLSSSPEHNTKSATDFTDYSSKKPSHKHSTFDKTPINDPEDKFVLHDGIGNNNDTSLATDDCTETHKTADNINNDNNNTGDLIENKRTLTALNNQDSSSVKSPSKQSSSSNIVVSDETQSLVTQQSISPVDDFDTIGDTVKTSLNETVISPNVVSPNIFTINANDTTVNFDEQSADESYESDDFDVNMDRIDGSDPQIPNRKWMNFFDRITKSSYFQKASENKYILKTMEYVSNTNLALQVGLQYLEGTLVLNIPPPPSDRLWWGFKKDVTLIIKAKPKVGQKEIQMTKAVEFIEKQLLQEFRKVAVLPNMDDITIPLLLNGDPEKYSQNLV